MPALIREDLPNETGGVIVTLKINRPDALNSFSRALADEFSVFVGSIQSDRNVRALVVTGTGRAFSTGADLKERATMSPDDVRVFLEKINKLFTDIENLPFPTIAALNGFALGGGLELALAFDLRLAAESALIGLTETSLGIIPGAGGTQRLAKIVGLARARELILTAAKITAARAETIGLVHRVTADALLWEESLALARSCAANAPIALREAKKALMEGWTLPLEQGLALERRCYEKTIPTSDRTEALTAFREKRRPVFRGE